MYLTFCFPLFIQLKQDQKGPTNESSYLSTTGGGDADTCKDDTTKGLL